jgi:hypothetical protein
METQNQQDKQERREMMIAPEVYQADLSMGIFGNMGAFMAGQRMAAALVASTMIPKDYQGNIGNCMIALDIASRLKVSPILIMQNLYIIGGRPAWYTQYVTAVIEASGKYKGSLRYALTGKGDTLECFAWAERPDGSKDEGPKITMAMAKAEGWYGRNGSKWQTMPEVMIRYRAASFFGRAFCSKELLGIYTVDEVQEIEGTFEDDRNPVDVGAQEPIGIPEEFQRVEDTKTPEPQPNQTATQKAAAPATPAAPAAQEQQSILGKPPKAGF